MSICISQSRSCVIKLIIKEILDCSIYILSVCDPHVPFVTRNMSFTGLASDIGSSTLSHRLPEKMSVIFSVETYNNFEGIQRLTVLHFSLKHYVIPSTPYGASTGVHFKLKIQHKTIFLLT